MTPRGRPRQTDKGASVSSRVRVTPVRRAEINAALFAKALIAAQLLGDEPALTGKSGEIQDDRKEEES